jgi:hypothetical protein
MTEGRILLIHAAGNGLMLSRRNKDQIPVNVRIMGGETAHSSVGR